MQDIRVGIIGMGLRSVLADHAHRPGCGARVVACCDPRHDVALAAAARYGSDVRVVKDYQELLGSGVDAVFVLSPDYLHEEHAIACLDAGRHVYIEKPMAITTEGCDRILAAAQRSGAGLYVGHNMRHMAFLLKMKQLINSGAIGEVRAAWCRHFVAYGGDAYYKDWHADRRKSTGLLLQKGAHDIDVLHWLCGGYTVRTTAMGSLSVYNRITDRHAPEEYGDASWHSENWPPLSQTGINPVVDVEDLSMMLMQLDSGVMCSYEQCHYSPDGWRNYTIIGTEGRMENFGDNPGQCVIRLWSTRSHYDPYGDQCFYMPPVAGGHGGADPEIIDEFLRYIRDGVEGSISPVAARHSVAAGCAATQSLRAGGVPVDVPPLDANVAAYFQSNGRNAEG